MAKTKKKINDKNLLAQSFNLKSRKVQFFVTILVVGLVGAGYFTLKSFAANLFTWHYADLKCNTNADTCRSTYETSKGSNFVYELRPRGSLSPTKYFTLTVGQTYQVCLTAKGTATINRDSNSTITINSPNSYVQKCFGPAVQSSGGSPGTAVTANLILTNVGGGDIKISEILANQIDGTTPVK